MMDQIIKMFDVIKEYRPEIKRIMVESLKHTLDLTADIMSGSVRTIGPHDIILLGIYNDTDELFTFINSMNRCMLDSLNHRYDIDEIFDSYFIEQFFSLQIKISEEDHDVIPIFIKLYNPAYNLIKFMGDGMTVYALVDLGIEEQIDQESFDNAINIYTQYIENKENITP
jgi:hypothetical protein